MDFIREEGFYKRKHTLIIGLKVCQHIQLYRKNGFIFLFFFDYVYE